MVMVVVLKDIRMNYAFGDHHSTGRDKEEKERHTSNVSLWLHILVEIGLYEAEPLLDGALDISAALTDVSEDFLAIPVSLGTRSLEHQGTYGVVTSRDLHLLP